MTSTDFSSTPSISDSVDQNLTEASVTELRHRPTLPQADLEAGLPRRYVGVDQGGGGCIVYRPDGTRVDLKTKPYAECLTTLSQLTGVPKELLQERFIEEKKGKTLVKAELLDVSELELMVNFFTAIWQYVVPQEYLVSSTVFVVGMTGKVRKSLFDLGLVDKFASLVAAKMNSLGLQGYFLLLDCDFESLMEARDFNKHSEMLEDKALLALVQIGSSSSQVSVHANIEGDRQVLSHHQNVALGSRFTKTRLAELESIGKENGPYFKDYVCEFFSKFDSLPRNGVVLNAAGYIVAALVEQTEEFYSSGESDMPDQMVRLVENIRQGEFVDISDVCEFIRANLFDAPVVDYFQYALLLEVLQTMEAKGTRYVLLERKLSVGKSYDGGIWSREFVSFLKKQPIPSGFVVFDTSTLP